MIEALVVFHNLHFTSSMANFGIGSYLFAIAQSKDIKCTLYRINDSAKKRRNRRTDMESFADFIKLESTAKQLIQKSNSQFDESP